MTDVLEPVDQSNDDEAERGESQDDPRRLHVHTPEQPEESLLGEMVTVTRSNERTFSGYLVGRGPDHRGRPGEAVLCLTTGGDLSLDTVVRDANLTHLLQLPMAELSALLRNNSGWHFRYRANVQSVVRRVPPPQLRVMDGVYMVSDHANADQNQGGEVPMPGGQRDINRVYLVMRQDNDFVTVYAPASGSYEAFNMQHTKFHRTFRATDASWCEDRVTMIRDVADYMRRAWVEARREDRMEAQPEPAAF